MMITLWWADINALFMIRIRIQSRYWNAWRLQYSEARSFQQLVWKIFQQIKPAKLTKNSFFICSKSAVISIGRLLSCSWSNNKRSCRSSSVITTIIWPPGTRTWTFCGAFCHRNVLEQNRHLQTLLYSFTSRLQIVANLLQHLDYRFLNWDPRTPWGYRNSWT